MFKKEYLGYLLIGGGGVIGALAAAAFFRSRAQAGLLSFLALAAAGCVVVGSVMAFSRLLDRIVKPVVAEINADIEDDLEDLKNKRATNVQKMAGFTGLLGLVFLFLMLVDNKMAATWGGLPVVIPAVLLAGVITVIVVRTRWFNDQRLSTPLRVFFIPLAGLGLALLLGQVNKLPASPVAGDRAVYNSSSVSSSSTGSDGTADFLDFTFNSIGGFDCDGDGCEVFVLLIALVVITLVLVVGSAFIPHFWFLSGIIFLTILALITIHEIRIRRALNAAGEPLPSGAPPGEAAGAAQGTGKRRKK